MRQNRRAVLQIIAGSLVAPRVTTVGPARDQAAPDIKSLLATSYRMPVGSRIRTDLGHVYEVAPLNATDFHLKTASGTKLYVLPGRDGDFDLTQFYTGDASAALQTAVSVATGRKINIPPGIWLVVDVDVTGAWLEFQPGAVIRGHVGAAQSIFKTRGNTRLVRPVIEVANTRKPIDGGSGNIITIGSYATDGTVYGEIEIVNGMFTCRNIGLFGLAISCLGRCENVRLRGTTVLRGRFTGGFQAHWGGEFAGDSHTSMVTNSYHPNNIHIEVLKLERGGPHNLGGHLGLSLSAAYDVKVDKIINHGWDRTDWIQPGDVYNLVAGEDQYNKIMSGIVVRNTEIVNPVPLKGSYNNILVSGVSGVIRTAGQVEVVCAADRGNMQVDHGEIRIVCERGQIYNTTSFVRMIYAKSSKVKVRVEGVSTLGDPTASLVNCIFNTDCEIEAVSKESPRLISGHGNIHGYYLLDWRNPNLPSYMAPTHRTVILGQAGGSAKVGTDATAGAAEIVISEWTGTNLGFVIKGTRLYLPDGTYLVLSRSQMIGTGITTIHVEPFPVAIFASTILSVDCKELDSVVDGTIEGAYIAVELMNCDGVSVPAHCRSSAKSNVMLSGINRRLRISDAKRSLD